MTKQALSTEFDLYSTRSNFILKNRIITNYNPSTFSMNLEEHRHFRTNYLSFHIKRPDKGNPYIYMDISAQIITDDRIELCLDAKSAEFFIEKFKLMTKELKKNDPQY